MAAHRPSLGAVYTVDALDRLIDVNRAFVRALPRELGIKKPVELIGRSLWDFVPGPAAVQLWKVLQRRVRGIRAPLFVPMWIDSFAERRLIDLELHALGNDDIRYVQQIILRETRTAIALLDPQYPRDERRLPHCGWCARVQVQLGLWMEIEAAFVALKLAGCQTLPRLEAAACTSCMQSVLQLFPARAA